MVNMRILIRMVFAIFIAKGIDCLGCVCDDFCGCRDCLKKKEYEEIEGDENNPAKELVNKDWFKAKKNKPVLKIFIKEENGIFKDNGNKVSFKLEGNNNPKIAYQNETEDKLNLKGKKYALFEIKTQEGENTVYLYCSDVESSKKMESSEDNNRVCGIFEETPYVCISVIACNTENVTDMGYMFYGCSNLTKLDLKNFNTENVTNMECMFNACKELTELDLKNFNTEKVKDMSGMFFMCNRLENLKFGKNFNTTNVENMVCMFYGCSSLTKLEFVKNFDNSNLMEMSYMFNNCSLPQETQDKILDKNK